MLAADEVWRLQGAGEDVECRLFRRFCDVGHYREAGTSRQGFYAVTPSGRLLASSNTRDPRRLRSLLDEAWDAWRQLSAEERRLDDAERKELEALWRWEDEFPEDGLVLEVVSRDLPAGAPSTERRGRARGGWTRDAWNRDWAWFRRDEASLWVPEAQVGAERTLAPDLARRLVSLHLLDNVRGQVGRFRSADVETAELTARVEAILPDGSLRLVLVGRSRCERTGEPYPRGVETSMSGDAVWSPEASRFTSFELVATGTRWGTDRFNGRRRETAPSPIGFVLRLREDPPRVAPAGIGAYGWSPRRR